MENVLLALFIFLSLGIAVFGKFQMDAPWWQLFIKWMAILGVSYLLFINFGETVTYVVFVILISISFIIHFAWCRKNGIHPLKATPRKKYYQLRGWEWKE